jgi:nucleotide-binding universal stress UspA family protein
MFKKILVASDGSGPSIRAAETAGWMARKLGAELVAASVAVIPGRYGSDLGPEMSEGYKDEWKRVLADTVKAAGEGTEERLLEGEEAAGALLKFLEDSDFDLLVMGRSGKGGSGTAGTGSVSGRLASDAPCSIMMIK